jgi:hypothetical protein
VQPRLKLVLATLFVVFTLSVSARSRAADAPDQGKADVYVAETSMLGSTKLDAGSYEVKADASNATFAPDNGRVVAKVSIQWKDETGKSASSNVEVTDGKIVAIHFKGKSRYAAISQ